MDNKALSRKAAGCSGRPHQRNDSSASQPRLQYEQSQDSPYSEDSQNVASRHAPPHSDYGYFPAPARRPSERSQAPSRQLSEQARARRYSEISRAESPRASPLAKKSSSSSSSTDSWDLLENDEGSAAPDSSAPPSYDFPGTWPAALNDATTALTQVGSATASYASALTRSGIGKAGWSVGAALTSTANRRAHSLVDWAADRTGTGANNLPGPIASWLKGGRKTKEERRRAEQERKEKEARRMRGGPSPEASDDDFEGPLIKDEEDDYGFVPAATMGARAVGRHGRSGLENYEGDERDEVEDDGMMRLFQYDD